MMLDRAEPQNDATPGSTRAARQRQCRSCRRSQATAAPPGRVSDLLTNEGGAVMPRGFGLSEVTKEAIWKLRAQGLSDREVGRRLGLARGSVSNHLAGMGGIRPRARRRPEMCLSFEEREEVSRAIAGGQSARAIARALGRSHTTIAREINRGGGRRRYRAHAAEREAWRRSRRPRATKLELCPELCRVVEERLGEDHSPEQIAGWLRVCYPDNEAMRVSHETIYRALYVQARGTLKRELTRH